MNFVKRLLSLLLVLLLVVGMIPFSARAATLDNGLEYEVFDTYVAITDYNGYAEKLTIPARIEGLPVTVIGEYAFSLCHNLREVILPEGVLRLEGEAFSWCENLTTVTLPETLSVIGTSAFAYCENLTNINLPSNLTFINDYTFTGCTSLLAVTIPDSVTYIGSCAFFECDNLITITLPASVIEIGEGAFKHCNSLLDILVDPENPVYSSRDGALFNKDQTTLILCPGGLLGRFTVPASVVDLEDAFDGCYSLTHIDVDKNNPYYAAHDGILYSRDLTRLIRCPMGRRGSVIIPDFVTDLESGSFYECCFLTSVTIPDTVDYLSGWLFSNCTGLTRVDIPDSVTYIGYDTFYNCSSLVDITIPDSVTFIEASAFVLCSSLTSITIPEGVTDIYESTFSNCTSLQNVDLHDGIRSIGDDAFMECTSLTSITIPSGVTQMGSAVFLHSGIETIRFEGHAPQFDENTFLYTDATAYYPAGDATWQEVVHRSYGGYITWVPYNPNNPFTDVPVGSFYEAPVLWAVENGITSGATETTFNPNGSCLRAQVVTFLHRAEGSPAPISPVNPFTDVKKTDFFYTPVLWAVHEGITNGVSQTSFGSFTNCNRAAVVTFLWRAVGSPEPRTNRNPFTDVKKTDFFYKPVLWAVENGITSGLTATEFGPGTNCNRAQVVTFLYRACN